MAIIIIIITIIASTEENIQISLAHWAIVRIVRFGKNCKTSSPLRSRVVFAPTRYSTAISSSCIIIIVIIVIIIAITIAVI